LETWLGVKRLRNDFVCIGVRFDYVRLVSIQAGRFDFVITPLSAAPAYSSSVYSAQCEEMRKTVLVPAISMDYNRDNVLQRRI
jgi:hypothetical protein